MTLEDTVSPRESTLNRQDRRELIGASASASVSAGQSEWECVRYRADSGAKRSRSRRRRRFSCAMAAERRYGSHLGDGELWPVA